MTALVFLFAVAVIFGAVLALEVSPPEAEALRPHGLISWLTGGNWPAKVGGGLLVVGVGSLLHYALINFDVAPPVKLLTGVTAAGLLALAATLTRIGTGRRAVSLALGGAAFGVAYLTAYSAFALFHYLDSLTGVAVLGLTALGAGVYAVTRGALSLALLAMLGAFLAPAFAIDDPGALIVYGYYAAASLMTLVMVAWRGWRPLIHLSFLFTLAGGVFFAWTSHYYDPEHAEVMLPALLVLTAIHVLMPLLEMKSTRGTWIERLDVVYAIALPAVAALLAVLVAPSRPVLALELIGLGTIWLAAAAYLGLARADGFALHAVIGVLLAGLGVAARYRDLPWELIALAFSVAALSVAARYSKSERLHTVLAGLVPLFGLVHVTSSLSPALGSPVFINGRFVERLIGAGLLMFAGHICARLRQSLDTLLWSVGIGWALLAIGAELVRWDLVSVPLLLHWTLVAAAAVIGAWPGLAGRITSRLTWLPIAIVLTATWAALTASASIAWLSLVAASSGLGALAIRRIGSEPNTHGARLLSAALAPLVAGIWAVRAGDLIGIHLPQFALSVAVAVALAVLGAGRIARIRSADWSDAFADMAAVAFALLLSVTTLIAIVRSPWALTLDVLCLVGLTALALTQAERSTTSGWIGPAAALGAGLVVQAALLRSFGPPGDLSVADIGRMKLPTLVSLVWASMGGLLTVWGRRRGARSWWVGGAVLLVAAAVKLVLVDFGSLGQLTNIFAMIAAGVVFMLVGWLAPMPPAAPSPSPAPSSSRAAATPPTANRAEGRTEKESDFSAWNTPRSPLELSDRDSSASDRKAAWTIAVLAMLILPLTHCSQATRDIVRRSLGIGAPAQITTRPNWSAPVPMATPIPALRSNPSPSVPPGLPAVTAAAPQTRRAPIETACSQWAARLPPDYTIYVAGGRAGRELDFTLPGSNRIATRFDVVVHEPQRNVVLVLSAYEPAIWNLKWSPATHIVGVWTSGRYSQELNGLEADTPVLRTLESQAGQCPAFALTDGNVSGISNAVTRVLGREIDRVVLANNGYVNIGHTEQSTNYVQGDVRSDETFRDPTAPFAGERGIERLLQTGAIRRATVRDMNARFAMMGAANGRSPARPVSSAGDGIELPRTYVIMRATTFPGGLYGPHAVTFLLPRGIERPQGDPGNSRVFDVAF